MLLFRPIFLLFFTFFHLFAQQPSKLGGFPNSGYFDLSTLVDKIKKKNRGLQSRLMSFKEWGENGLRQGEIKLKKPNKMKVVYFYRGRPLMEMYANEDTIHIHLIKYKIVYQQNVLNMGNPLKVLDVDYLVSLYNFSFFGKKEKNPLFSEEDRRKFNILSDSLPMVYRLRLSPKDKTLGFDVIDFWVDDEGYIRRTRSMDIENKVVEFYFFSIKDNEFIADSDFDFIIPASVRVIKDLVDPTGKSF